ncbi:hypothetical protein PAPYR_11414 [Paratrimastix pyriformis]|uniref:Uncharacterized protein n=1 Tax=Paratrimastix pyriformis TaxID=342808 RepID=A0ABQ8U3U4_9EUKA|nr:hypothetical protein PAPYR_11414 [Paratrimastix pyriformis]
MSLSSFNELWKRSALCLGTVGGALWLTRTSAPLRWVHYRDLPLMYQLALGVLRGLWLQFCVQFLRTPPLVFTGASLQRCMREILIARGRMRRLFEVSDWFNTKTTRSGVAQSFTLSTKRFVLCELDTVILVRSFKAVPLLSPTPPFFLGKPCGSKFSPAPVRAHLGHSSAMSGRQRTVSSPSGHSTGNSRKGYIFEPLWNSDVGFAGDNIARTRVMLTSDPSRKAPMTHWLLNSSPDAQTQDRELPELTRWLFCGQGVHAERGECPTSAVRTGVALRGASRGLVTACSFAKCERRGNERTPDESDTLAAVPFSPGR